MSQLTAMPDPERGDEHLSPEVRQRLHAVQDECQAVLRDAAPELAFQVERVKAAMVIVNRHHHAARAACRNVAVFAKNAAGMVDIPSRSARLLWACLPVVVVAEIALALTGVRYALGRYGEIESPFEDPVPLLAATGFVLITVKLGHAAAHEIKRAERCSIQEPTVPGVDDDPALARILTDPTGENAIPPHPIVDTLEAPSAEPPTVSFEPDQADGDDDATKGLEHLYRDERTRRTRLVLATLAIIAGLGLWSINGIMRANYNEALAAATAAPAAAQVLGQSAPATTTPTKTEGANPETVLIALGLLLFAGMTFTFTSGGGALTLREASLQRRVKKEEKRLIHAIRKNEKTIRAYNKIAGDVKYANANATNKADTARDEELA